MHDIKRNSDLPLNDINHVHFRKKSCLCTPHRHRISFSNPGGPNQGEDRDLFTVWFRGPVNIGDGRRGRWERRVVRRDAGGVAADEVPPARLLFKVSGPAASVGGGTHFLPPFPPSPGGGARWKGGKQMPVRNRSTAPSPPPPPFGGSPSPIPPRGEHQARTSCRGVENAPGPTIRLDDSTASGD